MRKPKMLLPWGKTTVLGGILEQWRELNVEQIAVVCAASDSAIRAELCTRNIPEQNIITNPNPERGMFSSVLCAARWNGWKPQLTHWVIALGDHPAISETTLRALLDFVRSNPTRICQPQRNSRGRHPVILPKNIFHALKNSSAENLDQFLKSFPNATARFDSDDAGLDVDLDTPEDYQRAVAALPK